MKRWLKRLRGAVLMGLAWAVVWAPVALLIGVTIVDPDNSMDEMWPVIGAYSGFLCGGLFSGFRWVAEGGRRLSELSLPRAGTWGLVSGALVGALPFAIGTPNPASPEWLGLAVIGSFTLMSVVSAVGSVLLARMARSRGTHRARAKLA